MKREFINPQIDIVKLVKSDIIVSSLTCDAIDNMEVCGTHNVCQDDY